MNDVVSERILHQSQRIEGDLGDQLDSLIIRSVIDTSLQDATSMTMSGDFDTVDCDRVVDELVVLRCEFVQAFLDDVIAVEILDERNDVQAQSEDDASNLVGLTSVGEEVDHLLDGSSTVHVERDGDELVGHRVADRGTLLFRRVFQELLTKIVSEGICIQR